MMVALEVVEDLKDGVVGRVASLSEPISCRTSYADVTNSMERVYTGRKGV
jgi:hypothetical protein